jgi:hypothetical protein
MRQLYGATDAHIVTTKTKSIETRSIAITGIDRVSQSSP